MKNRHLLLALAIASCTPEPSPALEPTPADQVPEISYSARAIAGFAVEGEYFVSPILEAPLGATRTAVLVTLTDASGAVPVLEARAAGGEWRSLELTWREGALYVARVELGQVAHEVELRVRASERELLRAFTWSAVIPEERRAPVAEGDIGSSRQALRADIAALGVIAREDWGARATTGCGTDTTTRYRFAIHHTAGNPGGDPAANLRGIQAYHIDGNGWCDIGYHFLVSVDGQLWEGRSVDLLGAHVGGENSGNLGISFIGCFHTSSCSSFSPLMPPDVMVDAGAGLLAGLADIYGIVPSATNVLGHRDHPGQSTSCPGDYLHARLDDIRFGGTQPAYAAEYVSQSFPLAAEPFVLDAGEVVAGYLEMRNIGTEVWTPGLTLLGTTEPRDVPSPLAAPDWLTDNRAATIDREVFPGESGFFFFSVRGPDVEGDYPQYFNLVEDGVAWFSDEGGPPDDQIQIRVTVVDVAGDPDAGIITFADAGTTTPSDGCGCRAGAPGHGGAFVFFALAALLLRRRWLS